MAIIVVALGGNALQRKGEASATAQKAVACETAVKLAAIVSQGHQLIIVHGNGPQVGNILLAQHAIDSKEIPALPLDTCVAMTQGSIGYWLQQALNNEFQKNNLNKQAVSITTQMVVNKDDPKFLSPDKPIGPFYNSKDEAINAADGQGYTFHEDSGRGWRRVVPSPAPVTIVETNAIRALINAGIIPIVAGGGGIPVIKQADNSLQGIEAVIDKDSSAALIAELLGADQFIILTTVSTVMLGFGTPKETALNRVSSDDITRYIDDGQFGAGSMLPKVKAAQQFVKHSGNNAMIGELNEIEAIIAEHAGTIITP
ncbi:carbamate kinase [Psychrobacter sp. TAE2020]|uniref:carbamate kinase n=1 Tax=Psychrobacter sp. TAE2020 TaxID=2846762 RepID=UPI001C112C5F|nr:carbamate kinase [Psychrobacter sp. TAE2020]MBU5615753.1 carbamate kinase [Psychrobacter sp. TAE2020]